MMGEQKANYVTLFPVKQCRVSFRDSDAIEHAVELEARTLYEAVGLVSCHVNVFILHGRHQRGMSEARRRLFGGVEAFC